MSFKLIAAACLAVAGAAAAEARERAPQSPLVEALARCKAQAEDAARLRCYEAAAGALTAAAAQGEVVVVNQRDLKTARRSLFGFSLPGVPFFGGDDSQDKEQNEVESKVRAAEMLADGKWLVILDTGATWQTTEATRGEPAPKRGEIVRIKKGALGSYVFSVEGGRKHRAMRLR